MFLTFKLTIQLLGVIIISLSAPLGINEIQRKKVLMK
jgi:hypothetical protein